MTYRWKRIDKLKVLPTVPIPPTYPSNGTFEYLTYFEIFLDTIVKNNFGPTYTTRFLYLANVLLFYLEIYTNYSSDSSLLTEPELSLVNNDSIPQEQITKAISTVFKQLYDDYNILLSPEFGPYYTDLTGLSQNTVNYITSCKKFLQYRKDNDNDGQGHNWNTNAADLPFPNKGKYIDVFDFTQDLSSIQTYSWTPLSINGSKKEYLTPYFGDSPLVLDDLDKQKYLTFADKNFPTETQRKLEIDDLNVVFKTLSDKQKVIAEYFEGGSKSVSPPGQWNIFLYYAMLSLKFTDYEFCKNMYLLNTILYTSGVVTWKIKKTYMQSRPIQDLRQGISGLDKVYLNDAYYLNPDTPVTSDKGEYIPYQKSNFITPPFPDYTSGHSAFSSSAANFVKYVTKNIQPFDIQFVPFSDKHKKYISPMLENTDDICTIYNINVKNKTSQIDSRIPNCNTSLIFNTWDEIAYYSGLSRIYGGIHTQSSNIVGIQLGRMICEDILKIKKLQ